MFDRRISFFLLIIFFPLCGYTQQSERTTLATGPSGIGQDTAAHYFSLTDCTKYALKNQPALHQSLIDEAVAHTNRSLAFSGWLPQVSGSANYQYNFQLPTLFSTINNVQVPVTSGVRNTSLPLVNATQNIFSPDLLLANRASRLGINAAGEATVNTKILLVANVTKAFYDVLLSVEQINVYKEDTARLRKNQSDAYNRYQSGVADKVDYKQATISLNNSMAQLKTATEAVEAKYATLKMLMGLPAEERMAVRFDTAAMMQDIYVDTLEPLRIEKRIEYRQLMTARMMQHETTMYYQLGFIPTVSAFYNYTHEFESNKTTDLYSKGYPFSYAGLQLNVPLFTGFRRLENVKKSKLQEERVDWDEVNLKLGIYTEYKQAMAAYKSSLYNLHEQGENVGMAREVYDIVKLQYSEGIKAYLDVIVAESDLQTSEINYLNALFQLLQSKVNLEKAMGNIQTEL